MATTPESRRSATAGLLARLQSNSARLAVAALLVAAGYLLLLTYIAGRSTDRDAELALGLVLIFGVFGALFLVVRPVFRVHRTLLRLFEQVAGNPEALPTIPVRGKISALVTRSAVMWPRPRTT